MESSQWQHWNPLLCWEVSLLKHSTFTDCLEHHLSSRNKADNDILLNMLSFWNSKELISFTDAFSNLVFISRMLVNYRKKKYLKFSACNCKIFCFWMCFFFNFIQLVQDISSWEFQKESIFKRISLSALFLELFRQRRKKRSNDYTEQKLLKKSLKERSIVILYIYIYILLLCYGIILLNKTKKNIKKYIKKKKKKEEMQSVYLFCIDKIL
jgi:hypothetical protein